YISTTYTGGDGAIKIKKCAFFRAARPVFRPTPPGGPAKNDNGYHLQQNPVSSTIAPDWRL
ncbi:hypothetical protein ACLW80_005533, partial [Escherichia coli]